MSTIQTISDRLEIEALLGEFTDAGMMQDYDRVASLFTEDGAWRIPLAGFDFVGREQIRAGIERGQNLWEFFIQNTHPGIIRLEGDTATGRSYISELGRLRDGSSHVNYSVYHDTYRRTADGWKFAERTYEIKYVDTTPLAGSVPDGPIAV